MKDIIIAIATKASKETFKERPIWSSLSAFYDRKSLWTSTDNRVIIFYENKKGLSEVYNSLITEENKNKIILFVHDDVVLEDIFLYEKLNKAITKYDIVGLAGAVTCRVDAEHPAWHLMADRSDYVGEVAHCDKNGKVWTTVFGPTESRALVIDGLFIAVNVSRALETGWRFDSDFSFHFYDISSCLLAYRKKMKVGVTPIRVVHHGLGDSMNTQAWRDGAVKFKEKWDN